MFIIRVYLKGVYKAFLSLSRPSSPNTMQYNAIATSICRNPSKNSSHATFFVSPVPNTDPRKAYTRTTP